MIGLGGQGASASSHREAPLISGEPQYDNTDTYAFRSPDRRKTVTLLANWLPFEEPAGGPNFYKFATDAQYDIKVDNDGDARPDVIYRWTFEDNYRSRDTFLYNNGKVTGIRDENLNFYQTYRLELIDDGTSKVLVRNRRVAPSFVGDASMPNYQRLRDQATVWTGQPGSSGRTFAGQAEDSFFLDLRVFDLLYGGDLSEVGDDTLAGFNVQTLGVQFARRTLAAQRNVERSPVIGVWSTTSREGADGRFHQVSRLGMPLVNELVIPIRDKDTFNASRPSGDAQFLDYVLNSELAELLNAFYMVGAPERNRDDLVQVFLTGIEGLNQPAGVTPSEQLRLNVRTPVSAEPNRLGVIGGDEQGYPNGRRLADDAVDISLQVVAGELKGNPNDLNDAVDVNDEAFGDTFPYVALPASGSDTDPHGDDGLRSGAASGSSDSSASALPVLPLSGIAAGLLALAAGAVVWVRRPQARPARSVA